MRMMILCVALLIGCGTTKPVKSSIDAVAIAIDPAYGTAVALCDSKERAIVDRQGSTEQADRADIAEVRQLCDTVFGGFELIRQGHGMVQRGVEALGIEEDDDGESD